MTAETRRVGRRRVFYIPGYDPYPPRRYRELYRKEGAAQAAFSGYTLAVGPRADGPYGWHVTARIDGHDVEAEIEPLVWSDLVLASMGKGIAATYRQLLRTAWVYLASGALFRLMRLRKGPVIAALYPVTMLIVQLSVALFAARLAGGLIATVAPAPFALAGLFAVWPVLAFFRRADNRLFAYYLMHDYAYAAAWRGAYPGELEARLSGFGDRIAGALASEVDEVLVVGHSSGAFLAVSVVADLIRAGRVPPNGPALGLLTLGQVIPMVSFLPDATRLRADLNFLAGRDEIAWLDVSAPGDGCAFALCDPVAVTGVAPTAKRWPLVISAAFTKTLAPETWKRLRWRFFRLHFQYLCAFDRPGDYDYFRLTAGPLTLAQRFAGRAPSQSRIEVSASHYTSIAA